MGSLSVVTSDKVARAIMGVNMIDTADAIKCFEVNPSAEDLAVLEQIPFSEEVLRKCARTHALVADLGTSVMDVWSQHGKLFYYYMDSKDTPWYGNGNENWAKKRDKPTWRLLGRTAVAGLFDKGYYAQKQLLNETEKVPEAREMVYMVIGNYLVTGEKLFSHRLVRTANLSGSGCRVIIGYFNDLGINISSDIDYMPNSIVGLAFARKCLSSEV